MAGERNYLRVPPDSSGKRLRLAHNAQVAFNTLSPTTYQWKIEREYPLSDGKFIHLHEVFAETSTSGFLDVSFSRNEVNSGYTPTPGTTIRDPDTNVTVATIGATVDVYVNSTNIVGYNNPSQGLEIDSTGSANIRFAEGLPQLDAFGKLRTSNSTLIGSYVFNMDTLPTKFSINRSHIGGAVTWDSAYYAANLQVDGNSGNFVAYTTNTYHHYFPGSSHLSMMTLALSHETLNNNVCMWGMFDVNDGFGFMRRENGKLAVFIRNSCDADPDIIIDQENWNGDKLDGTGDSDMFIDVSMDNLYWMDVQWLGAGRVRFGVYYNGARVVCHEHNHGNTKPYPLSATASLPLCFMNKNIGTTGNNSTLKVFCASVWTESLINDIVQYGTPDRSSVTATIPLGSTDTTNVLAAVMSPVVSLSNGKPNRTIYFPTSLNVSAYDSVTGQDARVKVEIYIEPVVSNLNFQPTNAFSTVVKSTQGTYHGGGFEIVGRTGKGDFNIDFAGIYNNMSESSIKNYAENGGFAEYLFATLTQGAQTVQATFTNGYVPIRENYAFGIMDVRVNGNLSALNSASMSTYDRYIKITGFNTCEIWADANFTIPTTLGAGTVTDLGHTFGYFGTPFYWAIAIHPQGPMPANPITCRVDINWKEIR